MTRPPAAGEHAKAANPFPFKLLTVALLVTAVILAGLAWQARSTNTGFERMHTEHTKLQHLTAQIAQLDEILTMSAKMAAATGDAQYETRYRREEPKLAEVIKKAKRRAPEWFAGEAAHQTYDANNRLVAMEHQALKCVTQGDRRAALQILDSEEYLTQKMVYSDGLRQVVTSIDKHVDDEFAAHRRGAQYAVVSVSVALPILLAGWLGVLRMVRKHMAERERSEKALRDADVTTRERAEAALSESEEQYHTLVENLNIGVYRNTGGPKGRFLRANVAIAQMFGYDTVEEFMSVHVSDLYQDPAERQQFVDEVLKHGFVKDQELRLKRKDGTAIWASCTATIKYDENGDIQWLDGVIEDITERKQAEEEIRGLNADLEQRVTERTTELAESEGNYRTLAESAQEFILTVDRDLNVQYANTYMARHIRRTPETMIGKSIRNLFPRDAALTLEHHVQSVYKSDQPVTVEEEVTLTEPAGKPLWLDLRFVPLRNKSGETTAALAIAHDITHRKKTEKELQESQRSLATLMSNLPGMAYRCRNDRDWTMEFVSEGCEALTGYKSSDLIDNRVVSYARLIHPDDQEGVWDDVQAGVNAKKPFHLLCRIATADGHEKWVWEQGRGVFSPGGELLALEGFIADITQQRQAEETLRAAAHQWQTTFDALSSSVCLIRMDGTIKQCNKAMAQFLGKSADEVEGRTCWELVHGSSEPVEDCPLVRAKKSGHKETTVLHVDNRWLEVSVDPVLDDDGQMTAAVHVISDITERKRAEEEIALLAKVPDENPYPVLRIARDGTILYANPQSSVLLETWGAGQGEAAPRKQHQFVVAALDTGRRPQTDVDCDGQVFTLTFTPVAEADYVNVFGFDITARKQAEAALQESEQRFRSVYETAPLAFVIWDIDLRINGWNRRAKELFGWTRKEALGQNIFDLIIPQRAHNDVKGVVDALLRGEVVDHHTNENVTKSGDIITCEWSNSVLRDNDGNVAGVMSLALDITDRTRSEQALRESEDRYRAIFGQAIDSVVLLDRDTGAILEFNDAAHQDLGYTREEFEKLSLADIGVAKTPDEIRKHMKDVAAGQNATLKTKHRRKDGEIRDVQVSSGAVIVRSKMLLLSIWRDVTDAKRSHERIEQQASILANVTDAVAVMRDDRTIAHWNKGAEQMFGHTEAEMLGRTTLDALLRSPDQAAELINEILSAVDTEGGWADNRLPCRHKDGREMWVHVTASRIKAEPDQPAGVLLVAKDVTEEVQLHERLIRSERLAAIGTLAAGVAHEMNNLLGGLSDLATKDEAVVSRLIDSARSVAERGGSITARLTSLARADQPGVDKALDLPTSVKTTIDMVRPLFGR